MPSRAGRPAIPGRGVRAGRNREPARSRGAPWHIEQPVRPISSLRRSDGQAWRIPGHEKRGDAPVVQPAVLGGEDHEVVGERRIGYEVLGPVEHVVVVDRDATCPERHDVGAGLRLRCAEGRDHAPVPHEVKNLTLPLAAEPRDGRPDRETVGTDTEQEASIPGSLTEPLEGAEDSIDVEVRVGDREAEHPEIGVPLPGSPELRAIVVEGVARASAVAPGPCAATCSGPGCGTSDGASRSVPALGHVASAGCAMRWLNSSRAPRLFARLASSTATGSISPAAKLL